MAFFPTRVLDRETRFMRAPSYVRGGLRIAPMLREEITERGLSVKELALEIEAWASRDAANRKALDWRTVKKATEGSCELDTALNLIGFFGWDFAEALLTPIAGADPLTAREAERDQMLAAASAIGARLDREHAARAALAPGAPDAPPPPPVRGLQAGGEPRTFGGLPPQPA